ncbi:MAG: transposase [candidate division Zixibacteria bacterium]|nr:transposase [candidate division Zixibacteria bacterium]
MARLKHIIEEELVYFITTTTRGRQELFLNGSLTEILLSVLKELRECQSCEIYAFVIMPDHLHLIIKPNELSLPGIMKKLKGKSARLINQSLKASGPVWQERYYEHAIRDEGDFQRKVQYVLYNPVTAGLSKEPEEYPYSSAHRSELVDPIA